LRLPAGCLLPGLVTNQVVATEVSSVPNGASSVPNSPSSVPKGPVSVPKLPSKTNNHNVYNNFQFWSPAFEQKTITIGESMLKNAAYSLLGVVSLITFALSCSAMAADNNALS